MDETYEEVTLGEVREFGEYEVTRAGIIEFAEQFDPQAFHVDEDAARESIFGGLVASGWHTASMTMRIIVDNYLSETGAVGSPGVDELRWPAPVRPGDVLRVRSEPVDRDPWDEGLGAVTVETTTLTDADEAVQTMDATILFPRP
jgi:acyl dehydratase